ncbi:ABC transporter substrate-binding protein [Rhizobacter sp. OV335]|uniref:ABC transporter substrate-binding protein n=1 Tax=Rhizobacter sp. OV335 TaxID=1500264 RepID=UPI00091F904E|nr:ABC transporter substrate-binding protein [Rhizobacter sp. OV335]SHM42225.1 peptide/nickel transport system substrate-binding protein [Rhizobacter sp. OV335]
MERNVKRWLLAIVGLWIGCAAGLASAASLRVASGFDPQTMDPHALALLYHSRVVTQVYESLVGRDEQFKLEPALALSWQALNDRTWRFRLRPGVLFHDGGTMSADDVIFSVDRARQPPSQRAFQLGAVAEVRKVDALTVDFALSSPDAVFPEKLPFIGIMSKAWASQHGVERAQDFNGKQETFAVRNANGTGPFRLERYEPDVRVVLKANERWWGRGDKRNGNLDEVSFLPIRQEATRLAALSSGEVDLVLDPPFQDVARLKTDAGLSVLQVADLGQQYLAFDQAREQLLDADVKGRNPFKDRRVRQAVYQAINVDLIVSKVLRGQGTPTGAFLSPQVDGSLAELDRRLPYDPVAAKKLLAQAGYPDGFAVTLDCVNIAWRENVCQAATAMLAQVGIRTTLRSSATNQFFPKLSQATGSFVEFGWTPTTDAWATLNALFHSFGKGGAGTFNVGRYANPALDTLIDSIRVEPDLMRRRAMVGVALRLIGEDLPYVPLYRRTLSWAMQKKVKAVQWPDDVLALRWVRN